MNRPFVYIASLRRTGSTVLAEALTSLPESFIFREPGFARGRSDFKDQEIEFLSALGVDLAGFRHRRARKTFMRAVVRRFRGRATSLVSAFKHELFPQLARKVGQIGVKEVRHDGWRDYLRNFPNARIILTARDPRDIYISMYHRVRKGIPWGGGSFTPEAVAAELLADFRRQREMADECRCLRVKYEDLCTDPGVLETIKAFAESPIDGIGEVGLFTGEHPLRRAEFDLHADRVTDRAVKRWEREPEGRLREQAMHTFDLMAQYCAFWEYER